MRVPSAHPTSVRYAGRTEREEGDGLRLVFMGLATNQFRPCLIPLRSSGRLPRLDSPALHHHLKGAHRSSGGTSVNLRHCCCSRTQHRTGRKIAVNKPQGRQCAQGRGEEAEPKRHWTTQARGQSATKLGRVHSPETAQQKEEGREEIQGRARRTSGRDPLRAIRQPDVWLRSYLLFFHVLAWLIYRCLGSLVAREEFGSD
jgi:hypothetical protein